VLLNSFGLNDFICPTRCKKSSAYIRKRALYIRERDQYVIDMKERARISEPNQKDASV